MASIFTLCLNFWVLISIAISTELEDSQDSCTLTSPPKKICGLRGNPKLGDYGATGEPEFVNSVEECALLCSRHAANENGGDQCFGFAFDTENKLCQLGNFARIDPDPKSSRSYYDLECFTCPAYCPQPIGAQLLDNSDFEGKLLGPWYSNSGALVRQGRRSSKAWKCVNAPHSGLCLLSQNFNPCSNALYAVRFFYKEPQEESSDKVPIMLQASQGFGGLGPFSFKGSIGIANRSSVDTWKEGSLFILMGPKAVKTKSLNALISVLAPYDSLPADITGYIVDDFSVFRMDLHPALKHGAKSVVVNGDFETGDLGPWKVHTSNSNVSVVSPGIDSDYAVKFTSANASAFSDFEAVLEQTLATVQGVAYLCSVDLRVRNAEGSSLYYAFLELLLNSGHTSVAYYKAYPDQVSTKFSIPFIARGNAAELKFKITSSDKIFFIDNVSLIELAKPIF